MILSPTSKGTLMILLSAIFFGLIPFFALNTYAEGVDINNMLLYRYSFAFILIALFCAYKKVNLRITRTQLFRLLFAAFAGTMLTTYTLFKSYQTISSGLASTLHFVYPVVTLALAALLFKEKFTVRKTAALVLSLTGIAVLSTGTGKAFNLTGIFWAVTSGFLYALYIILIAHRDLKQLSPFSVTFWIFGFTAILFFIKGLLTHNLAVHLPPGALFYILNLSVWSTFFAMILFFQGMKFTGPGNASLLSTLEPLTGVLVGVLVFHERLDAKSLMAILLILTSVFTVLQQNAGQKNRYKLFLQRVIVLLRKKPVIPLAAATRPSRLSALHLQIRKAGKKSRI